MPPLESSAAWCNPHRVPSPHLVGRGHPHHVLVCSQVAQQAIVLGGMHLAGHCRGGAERAAVGLVVRQLSRWCGTYMSLRGITARAAAQRVRCWCLTHAANGEGGVPVHVGGLGAQPGRLLQVAAGTEQAGLLINEAG